MGAQMRADAQYCAPTRPSPGPTSRRGGFSSSLGGRGLSSRAMRDVESAKGTGALKSGGQDGALRRCFDGLEGALAQLRQIDVERVSPPVVLECLEKLGKCINRLVGSRARFLTVAEKGKQWQEEGARTFKQWNEKASGASGAASNREMKRAQELSASLAEMGKALENGSVSPEHVDIVRRAFNSPALKDALERPGFQGDLIALAEEYAPRDFERRVRTLAFAEDPGAAVSTEASERKKEALSFVRDGVGMKVSGWLSDEASILVDTALSAVMGRKSADDNRSLPHRRARALVELATAKLDGGTVNGGARIRPHLSVHVPFGTLVGLEKASSASVSRASSSASSSFASCVSNSSASASRGCAPCDSASNSPTFNSSKREVLLPSERKRMKVVRRVEAGQAETAGRRVEAGRRPSIEPRGQEILPLSESRWAYEETSQRSSSNESTLARASSGDGARARSSSGEGPLVDNSNGGVGFLCACGGDGEGAGKGPAGESRRARCLEGVAAQRERWSQQLGKILSAIPGSVDLTAMKGLEPATFDDGSPLSMPQLARLVCDSSISRVVFSQTGEILDVGREKRLFTSGQARAVIARDRTCRYPGCTDTIAHGQIHHALSWSAGGATDIDNAVLLCWHHHQKVHQDMIDVEHHDGGFLFRRSDGDLVGVRLNGS